MRCPRPPRTSRPEHGGIFHERTRPPQFVGAVRGEDEGKNAMRRRGTGHAHRFAACQRAPSRQARRKELRLPVGQHLGVAKPGHAPHASAGVRRAGGFGKALAAEVAQGGGVFHGEDLPAAAGLPFQHSALQQGGEQVQERPPALKVAGRDCRSSNWWSLLGDWAGSFMRGAAGGLGVPQVSQPAVSPISQSAGRPEVGRVRLADGRRVCPAEREALQD